ncbi:hypothetical protein B0T20DRAFT_389823 [Sordaria brevicollis]|uniref:Uncharacterized protein n=1 Tax=Sordaria brevicollis TaxID=83679 RepID=A0AAE0PL45_SORBR|nr:hypothetical protein B0T20DRAFT_389823 [Sordaria brevicollis]
MVHQKSSHRPPPQPSSSPSGGGGVSALIQLKGAQNIHLWSHFLFIELEAENVSEYLFDETFIREPLAPPPPPAPAPAPAYYNWRRNRAKAMRILCSTFKDNEEVVDRLVRGGWWTLPGQGRDPAELWGLIWRVFAPNGYFRESIVHLSLHTLQGR